MTQTLAVASRARVPKPDTALQIEQQPSRILDNILDAAQEEHGLPAINQAMVVCESHIHHGAWENLLAHQHWTLLHCMHPKDRRLHKEEEAKAEEEKKHVQAQPCELWQGSTWGLQSIQSL